MSNTINRQWSYSFCKGHPMNNLLYSYGFRYTLMFLWLFVSFRARKSTWWIQSIFFIYEWLQIHPFATISYCHVLLLLPVLFQQLLELTSMLQFELTTSLFNILCSRIGRLNDDLTPLHRNADMNHLSTMVDISKFDHRAEKSF